MIKPNFNKLLIFYAMPHKGQISRVKLDQSIKELALPSGKPVEKVENGTFDPIIGPAVHTVCGWGRTGHPVQAFPGYGCCREV
jgi:hypothetical protein